MTASSIPAGTKVLPDSWLVVRQNSTRYGDERVATAAILCRGFGLPCVKIPTAPTRCRGYALRATWHLVCRTSNSTRYGDERVAVGLVCRVSNSHGTNPVPWLHLHLHLHLHPDAAGRW